MLPSWLWPVKTGRVFFDVWSIVHMAFWLVLGANWEAVRTSHKWPRHLGAVLGVTLVLALAWECFEKWYAEPHGWVAHPEIWFNRWLSDPLVGLAGVALGILIISRQ